MVRMKGFNAWTKKYAGFLCLTIPAFSLMLGAPRSLQVFVGVFILFQEWLSIQKHDMIIRLLARCQSLLDYSVGITKLLGLDTVKEGEVKDVTVKISKGNIQ